MGIEAYSTENSCYGIQNYSGMPARKPYTIDDLGIEENFLFENVFYVVNLDLKGSEHTKAPKLKRVDYINFRDSKISDLRGLEEVEGRKVVWIKPEE